MLTPAFFFLPVHLHSEPFVPLPGLAVVLDSFVNFPANQKQLCQATIIEKFKVTEKQQSRKISPQQSFFSHYL